MLGCLVKYPLHCPVAALRDATTSPGSPGTRPTVQARRSRTDQDVIGAARPAAIVGVSNGDVALAYGQVGG